MRKSLFHKFFGFSITILMIAMIVLGTVMLGFAGNFCSRITHIQNRGLREIRPSEFQECCSSGIVCPFGLHFSKLWDTMCSYPMKVQERFMKVDYQQ